MILCHQVNPAIPSEVDPVDDFKALTLGKVKGLRCPRHGKEPVVEFRGNELRDIRISMRACCPLLSDLANRAIAREI